MRHSLIFVSALAASACFSDGAMTGDTDESTGASGSMSSTTRDPTSSSASSNATGSASSDTSESTADGSEDSSGRPETSSSSSDTDAKTTSSSSSDDASATGPTADGVYAAIAIPGGLDRIRVTKRSDDAGTCTWVVLVTPSNGGPFGVTVTDPWTVESGGINDVPESCDSDNPASSGSEDAVGITGTIDLADGLNVFPCTVDIDVDIDFAVAALPVPDEDVMIADDIPVTGC